MLTMMSQVTTSCVCLHLLLAVYFSAIVPIHLIQWQSLQKVSFLDVCLKYLDGVISCADKGDFNYRV